MFPVSASWFRHSPASILMCVVLVVAAPAPAQDRGPAPAGDVGGVARYAADQENPTELPAPGPDRGVQPVAAGDKDAPREGDIGGDDGGTTWRTWAVFQDPRPGSRMWDPTIHIAEGSDDRCFVAYAVDPDGIRPREIHVAWYLGFAVDHEYDDSIRYRRAPTYASGGLAGWENMQSLTSALNLVDEWQPRIASSWTSPEVMITWERRVRTGDDGYYYDGNSSIVSSDQGANWSSPTDFGSDLEWTGNLLRHETTDRWVLAVTRSGRWGFRSAPVADPSNWSDHVAFADQFYLTGNASLFSDPAHDGRLGIVGGQYDGGTYSFLFDAEWRTDPGYPNFEPGFPVDLAAGPISDPAVVDLDGDGDLEIVFSDEADRIQVYQSDGSPLPGWPVQVSAQLSDTPVAVGDLNGDGKLSVVVGTAIGLVAAYDAEGTLEPGWPANLGVDAPVYVAIGAVGGPYPRAVVAGAAGVIRYYDWHGELYPNSVSRVLTGRTISAPPAVGDIDGDGHSEVVVAASNSVYAFPMDDSGWDINLDLEDQVTGGVSLGDFDLDGDVEILAPLANGVLHMLDGSTEPWIAISARDWLVNVLWFNGILGMNWPQNPDNWYIYGKPIIGRVLGPASDVILGARGRKAWAWSSGHLISGWPKTLEDNVYQTAAYGDLDLDGNAEIVFLSTTQLIVVDIADSPTLDVATWAMAGHDPERTGCSDCAVDVTAVDDAPTGVTRVSMAAPWPNPIAGQATFTHAVPVRARVELAIYDVRGRRVATVHRAEETAGQHVVTWNGRDGEDRSVASGQYVAALKVTGPGVNETLSRKVTVLR